MYDNLEAELEEVKAENAQLKEELANLKDAIKRHQPIMIDGGDMADHGWMTHEDFNKDFWNGRYDLRIDNAQLVRMISDRLGVNKQ